MDEKLKELYSLFGEAWFVYKKAVELKEQNNTKLKRIGEMPILYFGDINEYFDNKDKKEPRVVTVGKNPSSHEYGRFEGVVNNIYESSLLALYKYKLDNYFENVPYREWFGHWCKLLEGIKVKYGSRCCNNSEDENYALHTDFFSPIATDPVWSGLGSCRSKLKEDGIPLWFKLIKFLEPDIIIMSCQERFSPINSNGDKRKRTIEKIGNHFKIEKIKWICNNNSGCIIEINNKTNIICSNCDCSVWNSQIKLFCATISDNKKTIFVWIEEKYGEPLSSIERYKKEVGKCIREIWENINNICP